ncbi:DUF4302 domain-containing protein [Elizabethkingia anophelis]|nr:DUF4302 domain-containing protein [Elizabethkingia anophelis]
MTTKYFKLHITLLLLAMLLFWGCNSNRDAENFTQTPSERIVQAKTELRNILTSSKDGWKMIYFTDNSEFGGYTHLMSFTPDGKVTMASDFNKDALIASISDYELQSSYAPNLVFTTKNKIHLLSDSDNSPGSQAGAGYKGDFEFVYQKTDEKGNIHFRTSRRNVAVVFTKATAEDWSNLEKNFLTEEKIFKGTANIIFPILEVKQGDKVQSYSFGYNEFTRQMNLISDPSANLNKAKYGVGFKENALVLSPKVKIGNEEFSELVYDGSTGFYIAKGTQGEIVLKYSGISPNPEDYSLVQKILAGKRVRNRLYTFATAFTIDAADKVTNVKNKKLAQINLTFNDNQNGKIVNFIEYSFTDNTYSWHYVDIVKGENNTIVLKSKDWKSVTAGVSESLKTFDNYLMDPQGLLIRNFREPKFGLETTTVSIYSTLYSTKTAFGLKGYSFFKD